MPLDWFISDHGKSICLFFYLFIIPNFSGTHHKKTCSSESDIARWKETDKFYDVNKQHLFSTKPLSIHLKYEAKRPVKQTNGGWSDLRDRQLCLSFALKNTEDLSRIIMKTWYVVIVVFSVLCNILTWCFYWDTVELIVFIVFFSFVYFFRSNRQQQVCFQPLVEVIPRGWLIRM